MTTGETGIGDLARWGAARGDMRGVRGQESGGFGAPRERVYRRGRTIRSGPMTSDNPENALDHAARRLDQAIARLQQRIDGHVARAGADADGLVDQDRAKLAAELDAARARASDLAEAGAQASQALGKAILEVRAALGQPTET